MARLAPFAVVLLAGCTCACEPNWLAVDAAFCDETEDCRVYDDPPLKCGDNVCPVDLCVKPGTRYCNEQNTCLGEVIDEFDDGDECTRNDCDSDTGQVTHTPYTEEEIADNDPCTQDYCDPSFGIVHADIPNCRR